MSATVLWFRRDLRLADHPALAAAAEAGGGRVVGLFVVDPRLHGPAAATNRWAFVAASVGALDRALGGRLVVRRGDPAAVVAEVAGEVGAEVVFVSADFGPYGRRRDRAVEVALGGAGRRLARVGSPYAVDPGVVETRTGGPYRVFTPFYRQWEQVGRPPPLGPPAALRWVRGAGSEGLPEPPATAASLPVGGEEAAQRRLAAAAARVAEYAAQRDRVDRDATTHLSADLKAGCLHPRQVLAAAGRGRGAAKLRSELAWREFAADRLWHQPEPDVWPAGLDHFEFDRGPDADRRFSAWTEGRTGFPLVDAGMRQLVAEGWMPNRVRMAAASFLVKDLHLDWRRGAAWFLRHLVDGDLASNTLNWQWVAGVGAHASPWHRVFNPTTQARRHDPEGAYAHRWLPELAGGGGYPEPIVDHGVERREALARRDRARAGG